MSQPISMDRKISVPLKWHNKMESLLKDMDVQYSFFNNSIQVKNLNIKKSQIIDNINNKIQEGNFFEIILSFPEVDVEDLFMDSVRISFYEVLPYLEGFVEKGILFDFGENPKENCWLVDANECVKLISQEEHLNLLDLENRIGMLYPKSLETALASQWFNGIGINFLHKNYLGPEVIPEQVDHVLDFLNAFDNELLNLVSLNLVENNQEIKNLHRERDGLVKSSYLENLNKAPLFFSKLAKKISKEEDWNGIVKVFQYKDYGVYQLLSDKSKDRESAIMQHCVGNGGYDLSSGIYSLRDKLNNPVATIEIDEFGKIVQIQGFANQRIQAEHLVAIQKFSEGYLKIGAEEISVNQNSGWVKISFDYEFFPLLKDFNYFIPSEELPESLRTQDLRFFISDLNWKENLEKQFENKSTDILIRNKIINYFENNAPFVLRNSILGFDFKPIIKIPNNKRLFVLEKLAIFTHSNLKYFDEPTANLVRKINYRFKSVKNASQAVELLIMLDLYFQKATDTENFNTISEKVLENECRESPQQAFTFYKSFLTILKELYPQRSIFFSSKFWEYLMEEEYGSIVVENDFFLFIDDIKQMTSSLDLKEKIEIKEMNELNSFFSLLNLTQKAIVQRHEKNLQKEVSSLNKEILLFLSNNSDFISFFNTFLIHEYNDFDSFILEDKSIENSKTNWLLQQKIRFVLYHYKNFIETINTKDFEKIGQRIVDIRKIFNKISEIIDNSPLVGAKYPDENTPMAILKRIDNCIKNEEELYQKLLNLTNFDSKLNKSVNKSSQELVNNILTNWNKRIFNFFKN